MRVSSGRERRMTALNPRSLRSETAFKSTDHTADKLHAMALNGTFHSLHHDSLHGIAHDMAHPSMSRGYTCSFCRCTWSHRHRHRRAHQSQCWQAGQTRCQGQAKGIKGRQLLLQLLLLLLLEHVLWVCALPLQVSLVASPTAPSRSSVLMLARPDVGNLRSTTLTSTR
jgi:hypothetical protein